MKKFIYCLIVFVAGWALTSGVASACEKRLKTEAAKASDVTGTYTLILFGGTFADDLETFAMLDLEGDQYTLEPYAPEFRYRIKKGVPAKEALEEARKFVSSHNAFWRSELSSILDPEGHTIGYEVRPLYQPFVHGVSDVLDINYWLKKDNKVKVTIRFAPALENTRFPGGAERGDGGGS